MKEENYIREKELKVRPKLISIECLKTIMDLAKNNICKIYYNDGCHGTGFFCNIPHDWNNDIKVLITNNHILNLNDIQPGKIIKFSIDNDNKFYNILIDNSRKTYTNEKYDVTFIEIKIDDKIDEKSFFNLDKQIFKENATEIFANYEIVLLHYPKGIEMSISNGNIKSIDDYFDILHLCDATTGSDGGPIINTTNFQIIGIHKGTSKNNNYNFGTFLGPVIENFIEEKKEKNNINNNIIGNKNFENNKKLIFNEDLEEIVKYKIDNIINSKEIRIFGDDFVKNNKSILKIIIDGNEFELCATFNVNISQLKDNQFEIKLIGIKNVTNMNHMFCECESLSNLSDFSKWNTQNVIDMSFMFSGCKSLSCLPDISNWNTKNVKNISFMFDNCKSLSSLPDISKWNMQNVTKLTGLFSNCEKLSVLPDISKWDIKKVTDMSYMFYKCKSINSLPDISNWITKNVTNMNGIFYNCEKLLSLPDISKWDIKEVEDMSYMFYCCKSLSSLPKIRKWKNNKKISNEHMFDGCSKKLKSSKNFKFGCSMI